LATITLLVLNPVEMLRKARDGKRISELKTISDAINLAVAQIPPLNIGSNLFVYVSLPDTTTGATDPTCSNYNLPALVGGRTYQCAPLASYRKTDGSGWIPVNFDSLPTRVLSSLPVDPSNSNAGQAGLYYTYAPGSWELNAKMESQKYQSGGQNDIGASDGGDAPYLYEVGSKLTEIPVSINDRGGAPATPDTTPPTVSITTPANLATISGSTSLGATAGDDVAVVGVRFYYNSNLISDDTISPYLVSWDTTSVGNGSYPLTAVARDTSNNSTTSAIVNVTVNNGGGGDTTPPVRSGGQPSTSLAVGTTQTTISLTTDESATCKYSTTSGVAYSSMANTFSTTGGTAHSVLVTGLSNGQSYNYYVRCSDTSSNSNTNDFTIGFNVDNPFGIMTIGANVDNSGANYLGCTRYVAPRTGTIGSLTAYLGSSVQGLILAIYNSTPSLLGQSPQFIPISGNGWETQNLISDASVVGGNNYFLCIFHQQGNANWSFSVTSTSTPGYSSTPGSTWPTLPATFAPFNGYLFSIYANYSS
jgi:hypothetical protein